MSARGWLVRRALMAVWRHLSSNMTAPSSELVNWAPRRLRTS